MKTYRHIAAKQQKCLKIHSVPAGHAFSHDNQPTTVLPDERFMMPHRQTSPRSYRVNRYVWATPIRFACHNK
jgi:hypothetical protein